ncbi:MAG TPA: complex I subunit 1 family protein [Humisphaera sp.]
MSQIFHFLYTHVPPWALIAVISHLTILGTVAYLILLERKIASWTQDRIGPNRVGLDFGILPFKFLKKMFGLGQPLADGLKFILKEDYKPKGVDVILFTIAPAVMIIVIIISIAVIPWGGRKVTTRDVDITGAEQVDDVKAVDANIVASGDLSRHMPPAQNVPVTGIVGEQFWVTYKVTDAAGQTRQYHRFVDLAKHKGKDTAAVLREHLPAGATIVNPPAPVTPTGTAPLSAVATAPVVYPVELVRDADGTVRHVANDVKYSWLFAAGELNIGVLYVLAVLSLAVYGVVVGGWASNNKYSFLGGLRATANMISYEIPLGLVILCVVLIHGTLDMHRIVEAQAGYWGYVIPAWNVFTQPLAFVLFVICIHAEANRAPFDTAEAEQELVGGYHTEYSAMRFALFFLAEYAGMITTSAVCVALFLGGWHLPYLDKIPGIGTYLGGGIDPANPSWTDSLIGCLVRAGVFFGKTVGIIFLFMWVRWSLPRFRFDQIMILAWRALIPISLALLMVTATTVWLTSPTDGSPLPVHVPFGTAAALFVANVVVLVGAMLLSTVLPQPAPTNRRITMPRSRFANTPLPGKPVASTN